MDETPKNWDRFSDNQQLKELRKMFGMPALTYKTVPCKRCDKSMRSSYRGAVRITHFCSACHAIMYRLVEELF